MQGSDNFRLIVRRGPQPNQTYDLNKDIITLGRDITNDIVINDPEVSRHHLRLTRGAGGFTLEDLGSTNGTFINGQRLSGARPLNNGDMIGLGETVTLGYEMARGAASAPSPIASAAPVAPASPYAPSAGGNISQTPPQGQPAVQAQPQQAPSPYAPPQQQQPQQPPSPYAAQQQQPPQQGGYYSPPPAYGTPAPQPPAAGYDYDPYAMREEEPRSAMRWVAIGCVGLSLLCCCGTVIGLVIIDSMNLWYDIPVIKDLAPLLTRIARSLGLI